MAQLLMLLENRELLGNETWRSMSFWGNQVRLSDISSIFRAPGLQIYDYREEQAWDAAWSVRGKACQWLYQSPRIQTLFLVREQSSDAGWCSYTWSEACFLPLLVRRIHLCFAETVRGCKRTAVMIYNTIKVVR
jgi:hypothetical protein